MVKRGQRPPKVNEIWPSRCDVRVMTTRSISSLPLNAAFGASIKHKHKFFVFYSCNRFTKNKTHPLSFLSTFHEHSLECSYLPRNRRPNPDSDSFIVAVHRPLSPFDDPKPKKIPSLSDLKPFTPSSRKSN